MSLITERSERTLRVALWWVLIAGWLVTVGLMLEAATTAPSPERLEASRLLAIPTGRTFLAAAAFSALELGVILGLVWPGRPELYATRLAAAALALVTWVVITTPLELTRMDRVHRRWLAAMAIGLTGVLLGLLLYRGIRRLGRGARE